MTKNNIQSSHINTVETLKYTHIKTESQYNEYCKLLEELDDSMDERNVENEVELLTLLIEKWDEEHNTFEEADPIELLKYLMVENNLKAKDLADILTVSKGLISDMLNYKKGFSKEIIRRLSKHFSVSQEAFNRPYLLKNAGDPSLKEQIWIKIKS